jgi:uncharacterized protein (TIGR03083 family)
MTSEFDHDLATIRDDVDSARAGLLERVAALADADLDRARRGGWSVRRVLEHVIQSELAYSRLATHLRGLPPAEEPMPDCTPASAADAVERLRASRAAMLAAVDGVDEESFYRLGRVGHEEYSVLSLLENLALHDREHGPQIEEILSATAS